MLTLYICFTAHCTAAAAGLDLKTRRADYATPSTRTSKRRRRTNSDDDDDWIPGVEEAPRRSRRGQWTC